MAEQPLRIGASSNIAGASYDEERGELVIEFKSGDVYRYSGVPRAIADGLSSASSPGSYFFRQIRGRYAYEQQ